MCVLQQPPDGAEANGGDLPRHTLHASMQNVAEAVTLNGNGGGTGDAPCTPPRVVRPVTLQVPDVDGSGGTSTNLITDQGDTTTDDDEGAFVLFSVMLLLLNLALQSPH